MMRLEIPIKTVSEANCSEHWSRRAYRHRQQQSCVRIACIQHLTGVSVPCTIVLTRLSPRQLDSDNLVSCFKWIRDELSELILPETLGVYSDKKGRLRTLKGRADDDERITWQYAQEKSKIYAVRIEITQEEP